MSNLRPFTRRTGSSSTVPVGDVLGEYVTYLEAQKIVDRLAKADFAVKGLAIVGNDLKTVEQITGRLTYARAALTGAASGAWLGLFFGLLFILFSPAPEFSFLFAAGFIGAGFGTIFGIVSYAINRRRRDFSSTHQVLAGSYQIIIDTSQTARARQALTGGQVWPPPLDAAPADAAPLDVAPLDVALTDANDTDANDTAAPDSRRSGATAEELDASSERSSEQSSERSGER